MNKKFEEKCLQLHEIPINFNFHNFFTFMQNPPENFAQNLLKWVVDRTNKTSDELAVLIPTADPATNRVVCVDECFDGTCEPWDAGCHCCPFN